MRRKVIYPHRSVRSMPLTAARAASAILIALTLTAALHWYRDLLLAGHNRIVEHILSTIAIPIDGTQQVDIFDPIGPADVVTTPVFAPAEQIWRAIAFFAFGAITLFTVHRLVPLARSLVIFQAVTFLTTAVIIVFNPDLRITAAEASQIWLRSEVLVWYLLPWLSASLIVVLQPSFLKGAAWSVALQAYGFVWSPIRLAFCLGVLHYSGLLFMPLLWFTLGLLADVLYVVVFLSLSARNSGLRTWGRRLSWQF